MQNIVKNIIRCIFFDDKYNIMEEEIKEIYNKLYIDEIEYEIEDIEEIDDEIFTEIINDIIDVHDVGIIQLANYKHQSLIIKIHNKGKRQRHWVSIHSNANKYKKIYPLECFWWIEMFTKLYRNDFIIINC